MALAFPTGSGYGGEVVDEIVLRMSLGFESAENGLFFPHLNVKRMNSTLGASGVPNSDYAYDGPGAYIPRMVSNGLVQAYQPEPDTAGDFDYDEKPIQMGQFQVYTEFNPRDFEDLWRRFQPTGDLLFRALPGNVQAQMMQEVLNTVMVTLEEHFWQGDATATPGAGVPTYWTGIITQLLGSTLAGGTIVADTEHTTTATPIALTSANIVQEMERAVTEFRAQGQQQVAAERHPDFTYVISPTDYQKYREAQAAQTSKGVDFTQEGIRLFQGKRVVEASGLTENEFVAGVFNTTRNGELHYAVDLDMTSTSNMLFEKKNAHGDFYFIRLVAKAGSNTRYGGQILSYQT